MRFPSRSSNILEPQKLILRFLNDVLAVVAIYIILAVFTYVLGYCADLAQDPLHRKIFVALEYSIFTLDSLFVLLASLILTAAAAVEMYRGFRDALHEGGARLSHEAGSSSEAPSAAQRAGKRLRQSGIEAKGNIFLISALLFLGLLGSLELSQRQIESMRRSENRQMAKTAHALRGLRAMAIENFGEACRAGNGVFDFNSLRCRFPDGRVLIWRDTE